jgi:RNA recognition motif-containing protein
MLPDTSRDVFNREKHADYRDDMGGIGSFQRQNRTLYIGRIKETRNTAEMVERHFEEFGEIERSTSSFSFCASLGKNLIVFSRCAGVVRILQSRGVAFVTYFNELNAQFAKEAMTDQSLDSDEILNVR